MNARLRAALLNCAMMSILTAASAGPTAPPAGAPSPVPATRPASVSAALIDKYRASIPQAMASQNLPGLALAVVDENGIVWAEGFGYTGADRKTLVTPDTPFSLQSVSKVVTADAVMLAVQDGLLDLDTPITTYLPDFTVNSIFEERPEQKITLRHLLSHSAGFTHEAPVGNNNDLGHWQFVPHVKSISDTWLRFPVGAGYGYSNLGIDLAAYILQVKADKPFAQYVRERLFEPLGMANSTFNPEIAREMAGRAIGHMQGVPDIPVEVPMQASGGLYSTANDMAKFVQWHLNKGKAGDKQLLQPAVLDDTYKPRNPAGASTGYGFGIASFETNGMRTLGHSGGGFGFLSDVYWYPDLGLGAVVLTNSLDHNLQAKLIFEILGKITRDPASPYAARLADAQASMASAPGKPGCPSNNCPPTDLADRIEMLGEGVTAADQAALAGLRRGLRGPDVGQTVSDRPHQAAKRPAHYRRRAGPADTPLTEVRPGLFFSPDGEALDLRGPDTGIRN